VRTLLSTVPRREERRILEENAMRATKLWWVVPAVVLAAGCGKSGSANDDALRNDLALASQAQAYMPAVADTMQSPVAPAVVSRQAVARTPVRRTATPVRRSSPASSGTYYPAPAPAPKPVVKHTKRDAAIGAGAGAVIGAITSRDKVKGGIIGAVAGGILGGVIGNNVDVHRPPTD
jgi:hypothetical protein